jgi:hypothetical protein
MEEQKREMNQALAVCTKKPNLAPLLVDLLTPLPIIEAFTLCLCSHTVFAFGSFPLGCLLRVLFP